MAGEGVGFATLAEADAYAEFGKHLDILERLLSSYHTLLEGKGLTDKAFIPSSYTLNKGFFKYLRKHRDTPRGVLKSL